ncbi:MAG: cytochrome c-type biogenesis protein [Candidatus Acidiferrales bacterium]
MIKRSLCGMCFSAALALLAGALFFAAAVPAQQTPELTPDQAARAKALGQKLICMCGCNEILTACNHVGCSYSHTMLKELDDRIARGESDDLILQDFVQEYGPAVLAEPPRKGFDWLVWIAPVVLPIIAFIFLWEVVRRWRRHSILLPEGPAISPELLARARHEAGEESHE